VEGLIAGIFEGMDFIKQSLTGGQMDGGCYGMKQEEIMSMRNDAHQTNFAENIQFFMNSSTDQLERTWKTPATSTGARTDQCPIPSIR